ncbi:MAG TPA: RagB/SusD family nutrient uptake outer membrane protein, partial [Dinghuibacter sp.]|uniref:RagB/SusD family nutrient uptake outer membrane protein n=1 Tax=Dinghuibacter sp. TaxID=2024697 RepID=UPI002C5F9988
MTKRYISLLTLTLSLGACKKFLTVQPVDSVSDQVTIVDATSAETAVRGVYRTLSQQYYGGGYEAFGYLAGDNIQWTGSHQTDDQFIIHSITSDNDNLESVWDGIYATINGANQVIAKVPAVTDPSFTQAQKNQLTGEGYFIRALSYFDLARAWGGVPITLTPTQTATDKNGLQRSTL